MCRTARRELCSLGSAADRTNTAVARRTIVDRTRLPHLAARCGEEIRVVSSVPAEMVIIDGRCALLPTTSDVLVVRGSTVLAMLIAAYETWWRSAIPLTDERVVVLLASGLTDKSIARQLDVGLRTVQREVHTLLTRLDSRTRFQAGVRVGRMGVPGVTLTGD